MNSFLIVLVSVEGRRRERKQLSILLSVLALSCFSCESQFSWSHCRKTSKTCKPEYKCGKVYINIDGKENFQKDCLPPEWCLKENHYDCGGHLLKNSTVCDIHCCDDDNDCNAGAVRQISGILLLTCVLLSVLQIKFRFY